MTDRAAKELAIVYVIRGQKNKCLACSGTGVTYTNVTTLYDDGRVELGVGHNVCFVCGGTGVNVYEGRAGGSTGSDGWEGVLDLP